MMAFELQTKQMDWGSSPQPLLNDSIEWRHRERDQELRRIYQLRATEETVFESVGLAHERDYEFHDVRINDHEWIHTVHIRPSSQFAKEVYYMTHGFGGTSLFYYDLASKLLNYGEIVLMDLRGMGFSSKYCPPLSQVHQINAFFFEAFECVRQYYSHKSITLVAHSFGSYVSMLYSSHYPEHVKRQVLFSPIGITPKQEDYKSKIRSFSDFGHYIISEIGWKFELTYKTLLKYFACCCKKGALKSSFRKYGGSDTTVQNMSEIVLRLYEEPLCSERLFFKIFQPRVLPLYNLLEHFQGSPCKTPTVMIYGESDWVDKGGATKLLRKDPTIYKLLQLKDVSHQVFFECRPQLEEDLLRIITQM